MFSILHVLSTWTLCFTPVELRGWDISVVYLLFSSKCPPTPHRSLHLDGSPTDVCAVLPVGGPARGLAGERGIIPAATAADISELFIKRMTTLSSPISGPSCTGVLLLLSGKVSSILLPCYSLELLMANTIPPFLPGLSRLAVWIQAWRGGESGEIGGFSPRVPFLDRRQSGPFGHQGWIYGTV